MIVVNAKRSCCYGNLNQFQTLHKNLKQINVSLWHNSILENFQHLNPRSLLLWKAVGVESNREALVRNAKTVLESRNPTGKQHSCQADDNQFMFEKQWWDSLCW